MNLATSVYQIGFKFMQLNERNEPDVISLFTPGLLQ